ncbi:putative transferase CAF17 [Yarrowia sp. B02]|nr:putative transferase CAF17 [Yarrowia sp. B02]
MLRALQRHVGTHLGFHVPLVRQATPLGLQRFNYVSARRLKSTVPQVGRVDLTDTKSMVHVRGRDAAKLLNGLFTLPVSGGAATPFSGVFGAFLNGKGRVITDAFLYTTSNHTEEDQSFVIEFDRSVEDELLLHLKRHKIRAKVQIEKLTGYECVFIWNRDATPDYWRSDNECDSGFFQSLCEVAWSVAEVGESSESSEDQKPLYGLLVDDRYPLLGIRMILPAKTSSTYFSAIPSANLTQYNMLRYIRGTPEGSREIPPNKALPMESDLDYMNGLDFNRGCYVGQELTIRTHHTGVVRKRIVPFQLYQEGQEPGEYECAYDPELSEALPPLLDGSNVMSLNSPPEERTFAKSPFDAKPEAADEGGVPSWAKPKEESAPSSPKPVKLGNILSHHGNVGMALVRLDKIMGQQDIQLAVELPPGPNGEVNYLRAKLYYPLFVSDVSEAEAEAEVEQAIDKNGQL